MAMVGVLALTALLLPTLASADLAASTFEIDADANLLVNTAGDLDWAAVTEIRRPDLASGSGDDSFGNGSKEDTAVPSVIDGSIPPNKSDLKNFGVYLETTTGGDRFLHLFWHRVQDPSGTTNMDFEFNQSSTTSGNGVTPVRVQGDVLIQYDLANGGTNPLLFLSRWLDADDTTGTCEASNKKPCWSTKVNLSAASLATGSINTTAISAPSSDGLGAISPRTFGEATVDFDVLAGGVGNSCASFGSAYLKSRSSDAFSSALKDFIAPTVTDLDNCGKVIIRKQTLPDGEPGSFAFTDDIVTDPARTTGFSLEDDGVETIDDVVQGTYTVTEPDVAGDGWDLSNLTCTNSATVAAGDVSVDLADGSVTFTIDNAADVVDCTFTNQAKGSITVVKRTADGAGAFDFTSTTLTSPFTLTTTEPGEDGQDSDVFADLTPGTYDVAETVPASWNLSSSSCDDGSNPGSIGLSAGEDITCTFVNTREVGALNIVKLRKHAASGAGWHPHNGVTFTVTGGELPAAGTPVETAGAVGSVCVPGLVVSSLVGNYTVVETLPAGYVNDDDAIGGLTRAELVVTESTCAAPSVTATFHNIPLTDVKVLVDSQVPGGTASTIDCTPLSNTGNDLSTNSSGDSAGDGELALTDLEPGTWVCEVVIDP